jgi:hypothetical protein
MLLNLSSKGELILHYCIFITINCPGERNKLKMVMKINTTNIKVLTALMVLTVILIGAGSCTAGKGSTGCPITNKMSGYR